jgi:hypothetical protein
MNTALPQPPPFPIIGGGQLPIHINPFLTKPIPPQSERIDIAHLIKPEEDEKMPV